LRQWITTRKPGLLVLLGHEGSWDQAGADRLLAELRTGLARIERQQYDGRFPEVLGRVVADLVAGGEGYARDHAMEAGRGWDALQLLRGAVPWVLSLAKGGRPGSRGLPGPCTMEMVPGMTHAFPPTADAPRGAAANLVRLTCESR